jgi:MFS transporter, DHA1 family, inner membrane transport protein
MTAISTAPTSQNHLVILMAGIAAVGIQALMLSPLLPDIAQALAAGPVEIGIASGAYGAGVALAAFLAAPRLGQWRKRRAIQIAFAVIAVGLALCAAAFDWRVLVAGQFVTGLAAGVIIPGTYALTADLTPDHMRSRAMGRVIFGWSVAMVAGIPLAALIADLLDWRGTFLAVAVISAGMIFGIGLLPRTAAVAATRPVPYRRALAVKGIPLALIATFVFMIAFYQTYTFLGDHVRHLHQAGAWLGGLVACSYGVGFGLAVFFDAFIDRVGPARLMAAALFVLGINYILLPLSTLTLWTAIAYPVIWGLAQHVGMNTLVSYIGAAPPAERSTAMGLFSFITYVAVGLGGGVYGSVYANYGFFATSLAATASLWIGAILVLLFLPRSATPAPSKFH